MRRKTTTYSVAGLIDYSVNDVTSVVDKMFGSFNDYYAVNKIASPKERVDVAIEIGDFKPRPPSDAFCVGEGEFYFADDYIYVRNERYKSSWWTLELEETPDGPLSVRINSNNLGRLFIAGHVIDFVIHLSLLKKGLPLIHASAVSTGEKGIMLSSRGGGGKTLLSSNLANRGYDFLADNFVIVQNPDILAFPTPLNLFTYNLSRDLRSRLSIPNRLKLVKNQTIYAATGGYAKFFVRIDPRDVFERLRQRSPLALAAQLVQTNDEYVTKPTMERISVDEFAHVTTRNQMLEFRLFRRYLDEYAYFFPFSDKAVHWDRYDEAVRRSISGNVKCFRILVPQQPRVEFFECLSELLESEIGVRPKENA